MLPLIISGTDAEVSGYQGPAWCVKLDITKLHIIKPDTQQGIDIVFLACTVAAQMSCPIHVNWQDKVNISPDRLGAPFANFLLLPPSLLISSIP